MKGHINVNILDNVILQVDKYVSGREFRIYSDTINEDTIVYIFNEAQNKNVLNINLVLRINFETLNDTLIPIIIDYKKRNPLCSFRLDLILGEVVNSCGPIYLDIADIEVLIGLTKEVKFLLFTEFFSKYVIYINK